MFVEFSSTEGKTFGPMVRFILSYCPLWTQAGHLTRTGLQDDALFLRMRRPHQDAVQVHS